MSNTFFGVAVDCADAAALASFWAEVLGREVAEHPTEQHTVVLVDDEGVHGPRLAFHQVPEPKTVKNRLHLDLITTEFEVETKRLLGLGAKDPRHRTGRRTLDDLRRRRRQRVRPHLRLTHRSATDASQEGSTMGNRTPKIPGRVHPITVEPAGQRVIVWVGDRVVADTITALTLRQAGYPPVRYIPINDVDRTLLRSSPTPTYCLYKDDASYYSIAGPDRELEDAIWTYEHPRGRGADRGPLGRLHRSGRDHRIGRRLRRRLDRRCTP